MRYWHAFPALLLSFAAACPLAAAESLYVVCDNDPAGRIAREALVARASEAGVEALALSPMRGDFNDDLVGRGRDALRAWVRPQLAPEDVSRFMGPMQPP